MSTHCREDIVRHLLSQVDATVISMFIGSLDSKSVSGTNLYMLCSWKTYCTSENINHNPNIETKTVTEKRVIIILKIT